LDVREIRDKLVKDRVVKKHPGQLEIGVGQDSLRVRVGNDLTGNVDREFDAPHRGRQGFTTTEPNAPCTKGTSVTKPNVVGLFFGEFADVGWASCEFLDKRTGVQKGFSDLAMTAETDKLWEPP
jgi:hypothetical protein